MVQVTNIEWTATVQADGSTTPGYTSNPVRYRRGDAPEGERGAVWACVKASEGCQNCYAETLAKRFQGREFTASAMREVVPYVDEAEVRAMLSPRRLPAGSKCFIGDMTDVFGPWVPFEHLDRVFAVMALRPDVVFQLLTKRPERMREYVTDTETRGRVDQIAEEMRRHAVYEWPLPNVWAGCSVENQRFADIRIPELLATPAAVRFVSCEPLLSRVDLGSLHDGVGISWVIVGGESGAKARPFDLAWARSIVAQCRAAGVAVFVKQLGSRPVESLHCGTHGGTHGPWPLSGALTSRHGSDMAEWPQDLRVREFPVREWMADSVNRVVTSPQMALGDAS